jgi:hypothetical protein
MRYSLIWYRDWQKFPLRMNYVKCPLLLQWVAVEKHIPPTSHPVKSLNILEHSVELNRSPILSTFIPHKVQSRDSELTTSVNDVHIWKLTIDLRPV